MIIFCRRFFLSIVLVVLLYGKKCEEKINSMKCERMYHRQIEKLKDSFNIGINNTLLEDELRKFK